MRLQRVLEAINGLLLLHHVVDLCVGRLLSHSAHQCQQFAASDCETVMLETRKMRMPLYVSCISVYSLVIRIQILFSLPLLARGR